MEVRALWFCRKEFTNGVTTNGIGVMYRRWHHVTAKEARKLFYAAE
jgi:hypothetical protein